jgi:hypothetical protein
MDLEGVGNFFSSIYIGVFFFFFLKSDFILYIVFLKMPTLPTPLPYIYHYYIYSYHIR